MKIELLKWDFDKQSDLIKICNSANRNYLSNRLPFPYKEEDAKWWISMVLEHDEKDGIFRAIALNGKLVGNISIEVKNDVFYRDGEIGYFLLDEYCGKGIMTESVKKICDLAFKKLDLLRITGLVYSPNIASEKVLLKNGFELEGIKRKAVYKNENIYDLHIYGKLK